LENTNDRTKDESTVIENSKTPTFHDETFKGSNIMMSCFRNALYGNSDDAQEARRKKAHSIKKSQLRGNFNYLTKFSD